MYFRGGFTAAGAGDDGAVSLSGAIIGGSLDCSEAELRNGSGPALNADGLQVGQDGLCDRLRADGGIVLGGHIGRLLSFEGATISNPGGAALLSDGLRVDGPMFCRNGFTARGEVRLPGAQIGGRLYFDGAKPQQPRRQGSDRLAANGRPGFLLPGSNELPATRSRLPQRARSF